MEILFIYLVIIAYNFINTNLRIFYNFIFRISLVKKENDINVRSKSFMLHVTQAFSECVQPSNTINIPRKYGEIGKYTIEIFKFVFNSNHF